MLRVLLSTAVVVGLATIVVAQADPIAQRKDVMKGVGAATKLGGEMAKGEKPFELAEAQKILKTYADAAATFHTYFPDSSKTGGKTTAAPKVWETPDEFRAQFEAWAKDIRKASDDTKDLNSFRGAFGAVTKACKACHDGYRIKT